MKQSYCIIAAIAVPILGVLIFFATVLGIGGIGGEGQGEDPGSLVAGANGGWTVVRMPPSWDRFHDAAKLEELRQTMQEMVNKYNLPADEFMAVLDKESGGNPNIVSSAGALGLAQFLPGTAREYSEFDPPDRANNRNDPVKAMRAAARKLSTDRAANGGFAGGTLREAYVGVPTGRGTFKAAAYNPGVDVRVWDGPSRGGTSIKEKADSFQAKGYVVFQAGSSVANNTGVLSPSNLLQVSQQFMGTPYGADYESIGDDTPRCLNCQTFVESVMSIALENELGGRDKSIPYITHGAAKKGRIQTPIPGWLHTPNGWPASEATLDVAKSSGIESDVKVAHWKDFSGGLGDVSINYIPWDKVPELKGNETIDGTIFALIGKPDGSPSESDGVTHVGFLFNRNGTVIMRHSTKPVVLDVPIASRVPRIKYVGVIILKPDISKLIR